MRIAQETMEHLEDDASQTQTAQEPIPRPSKRVIEILECLNQHGEMRHGELADAVDSSYSALSNLMKKILQTGLARSRRTGRNTCYQVTDLGQHFCRQEAQREEQRAEFEAAVEKRAKELAEQYRLEQFCQQEEQRTTIEAAVEKRARELAEQYWLERNTLPAFAEETRPSWTDRLSRLLGKKGSPDQRRNKDEDMYLGQKNPCFGNSWAA